LTPDNNSRTSEGTIPKDTLGYDSRGHLPRGLVDSRTLNNHNSLLIMIDIRRVSFPNHGIASCLGGACGKDPNEERRPADPTPSGIDARQRKTSDPTTIFWIDTATFLLSTRTFVRGTVILIFCDPRHFLRFDRSRYYHQLRSPAEPRTNVGSPQPNSRSPN